MLEEILLTIVIGYAFSYIAVKAIGWAIDWDCRRKNSPAALENWIRELKSKPLPEQQPEHTESSRLY